MKIQSSFPLKQNADAKAAQLDGQLKDAAKMYENHFLNQMVKAMRSTIPREDGLIKQNMAEKIFTEQLDNQYVQGWTDKGGVGLADLIYNQIREKYVGATKKDFSKHGAIPIAPKEQNGLRSTDSIQMKMLPVPPDAKLNYRFEVQDPSGAPFEAVTPMSGEVKEARALGDGWNLVRMDHGQGLATELTFPGALTELSVGQELEAGRRLGVLDSGRPVLAWKLDWS